MTQSLYFLNLKKWYCHSCCLLNVFNSRGACTLSFHALYFHPSGKYSGKCVGMCPWVTWDLPCHQCTPRGKGCICANTRWKYFLVCVCVVNTFRFPWHLSIGTCIQIKDWLIKPMPNKIGLCKDNYDQWYLIQEYSLCVEALQYFHMVA